MQKTDEEIASQVQAGDTEVFRVLIERYEPKMRRYIRRFLVDADEVDDQVQEVFIKAYTHIQSFNTDRAFSPWLYRIAHNQCINELKRKKKISLFSFFDTDTVFPHPVAKEQADKDILDKETKKLVEDFLDGLEPKYREPLVLYYFEELGYKEISDIMRVPVSTIGVRINRGKKLLKKMADAIV